MRRWLLTSVVGISLGMAAPGLASAAQSFSISSPSGGNSFPANGNVPYTTTMQFDSGKTPQRALITTSPGVLAALSANPSCVQTRQITDACKIGDGQAFFGGVAPAALSAYLVPANDPAHDVAGVDLVAAVGNPTHAEIQLKQNSAGNVSAVLNVDFSGAPPGITGSTLTVNKTVNGRPFTRMPSNCSPGPSSLAIQYADGTSDTTAASPDFNITGCSSLPYSPKFAAVVTKDARDDGVKIVTTITQGPEEAATAANGLTLPWPAVAPNFSGALVNQNTTTPVGSVTATSPLLPTPLTGNAYLTGTPLGPTLTLLFPAPNALKLVGTVSLPTHTVTFNGVPDVPQTGLVVTLFGGPHALEVSTCNPPGGTAVGSFTGQNGAAAKVSQQIKVIGCKAPKPVKPSVSSASLSGLSSGKPVLQVALDKGSAKLKSFTLSLPRGLRFAKGQGRKGLSVVPGGKVVALHGGKLTIKLNRPAISLRVKLSGPLLVARKHGPKHPKVHISVTDATGRTTKLTASL